MSEKPASSTGRRPAVLLRSLVLKDKWGIHWQITPTILTEAFTGSDRAAAKRAFDAMMTMKKIDIAAIKAAIRGED